MGCCRPPAKSCLVLCCSTASEGMYSPPKPAWDAAVLAGKASMATSWPAVSKVSTCNLTSSRDLQASTARQDGKQLDTVDQCAAVTGHPFVQGFAQSFCRGQAPIRDSEHAVPGGTLGHITSCHVRPIMPPPLPPLRSPPSSVSQA